MMPPIADDIAAAYLPRPLPPPATVELHHQPQQQQQRRWKPSAAAEAAPNCPRCDSPNTKFCYYNNYSLAQPRYFCKGCRRYWTKGGSLRNVPVGGGCRKNRRGRSSSLRQHQDGRGRADQAPSAVHHHHQQQHLGSGSGGNSAGMLEDIAGSGGAGAASSTTSSSGGTSRASDGSDIDLAVLYAKYLSDQSSEHESSSDGQQLAAALDLPGAAAAPADGVVDVEPTFEFDYAALGHQIPACGAAGHFSTTSGMVGSSEAPELGDLGFDGGPGQFQYILPETDGISSSCVDDAFWMNCLPAAASAAGSTWQAQCPADPFVLPMIPDQPDPLVMMGPLAHHQGLLLGGGGGGWPALDPWSIDAVTRL